MTPGRPAGDGWPPHILEEVQQIARSVARRAPAWSRDDVRDAAVLAMWEAWLAGSVDSPGGLRTVARKAAGRAWRAALYCCADQAGYRAAGGAEPPVRLDRPVLEEVAASSQSDEHEVVGVLARLVETLVLNGMCRAKASAAVEAVADLTSEIGVHAVYNSGTEEVARRASLDARAARALVVLVIGQPRARNGGPHPGLVVRALGDEAVWQDERVRRLVSEVVRPRRAYVRNAWSEGPPQVA